MARNIAWVEHQQGSTKMIVYSGGELEVQSGGKVSFAAGSSFDAGGYTNITGVLEKESTGKIAIKGYTTHSSTSQGRLKNWGHSYVVPTSSGIHFRIAKPTAGIEKYITINSTVRTRVWASTANNVKVPHYGILVSSTHRKSCLLWLGGGGSEGVGGTIHLRGMTTNRWLVISKPSTLAVQFTTST